MVKPPLRIVFLDRETIAPHISLRPPRFAHELVVHERSAADEVSARIREADVVITNKVRVSAQDIAAAGRLKLIAVAATGVDNVDLDACAKAGVTVSNIRDYARNTVPEHTLALIFALRRSLPAYRRSVAEGAWQRAGQFCYFDYPINDLAGSTLGIVGRGTLGQSTGRLAAALGMTVLYAGRKGSTDVQAPYVPFDEMLARSDIISLHCPLTEHTRNLIGAGEFAAMQRRPLIINTARGGLVDEHALAHALRSGQISGAGFDVTRPEPPPADSPLMQLLDMPNFILTPHVGWASNQAMQALADQLIDNIEAFERGEPRNCVQP
ncbi:MAG: D-2-hydroxyacid dehydrogenase [Castellaniella sp.]